MAIIGTHALLYTSEPEKLRATLRDVQAAGFGTTITMVLPGGVDVTLYQPRHPLAIST